MRKRTFLFSFALLVSLATRGGVAQQTLPAEVGQSGYPETLFVHGQIVSMDDRSTSTSVGHIYQAIAIASMR